MNQVIIVGRLTADPIHRIGRNSEKPFATFTVAANHFAGKEIVAFVPIICFGRIANFVTGYVRKGHQVLVQGYISNRQWIDQKGTTHYTLSIATNSISHLETRVSSEQIQFAYDAQKARPAPAGSADPIMSKAHNEIAKINVKKSNKTAEQQADDADVDYDKVAWDLEGLEAIEAAEATHD